MQINNEARRGGTDRQTDRRTDRHTHKNDYHNPPAHAPRVNDYMYLFEVHSPPFVSFQVERLSFLSNYEEISTQCHAIILVHAYLDESI